MKLYLYVLLIICHLIISISVFAQEIIYNNDTNESNFVQADVNNIETGKAKADKKVSYALELGSIFSTTSSFGNSLSFYTAPQLKYRLAPKISISAGIMLINTSITSYYFNEHNKGGNFNQAYFFSGFDYQASQKLILSGEILYGMNKSPYSVNNNISKQDYYLRFNAEYKINKNLSIGLQVINQNMGYPGYGNSFGYDLFNNGLYNPFGR